MGLVSATTVEMFSEVLLLTIVRMAPNMCISAPSRAEG